MSGTDTHIHKARKVVWMLKEVGIGGQTYYFEQKHLALESLENTFPGAVEEQKYKVRWNNVQDYAQIHIWGTALYELKNVLVPEVHAVPVIVRRPIANK